MSIEKEFDSTWQRHKAGECLENCWYCRNDNCHKCNFEGPHIQKLNCKICGECRIVLR